MTSLFVSDIHLNGLQPEITAQFAAFLRGAARSAERLYILGDLFEYWIGDDDPDPTYAQIQAELRTLTDSGVACHVMHGNRDFLLGNAFCARTGCQLLDDGVVMDIHGARVLLSHGDVLCTDDLSYQRLRRLVRSPLFKWMFARLPLRMRARLVTHARAGSRRHTQQASQYIMDVNPQAVTRTLQQAGVSHLVHGHTHRPGIHQHALGAHPGTRIVLGDWHAQGSVLRWSESGYELLTLPR